MTEAAIFIDPMIAGRFDFALKHRHVILFTAPCGSGKTTAATTLLEGRLVESRNATEPDCLTRPLPRGCSLFMLDDLQMITDEADQQALVSMIVKYEKVRYIFLTRGVVPGWLMPFQLAGIMETFTLDDLCLDIDLSRKLLESAGATVTASEMLEIQRAVKGYPIALRFLADRLATGKPYCNATLDAARLDIFRYFDEVVFRRFERPLRDLLLSLAPFDSFTPAMAEAVNDELNTGELLGQLERNTTMLVMDGLGAYRFHRIFHLYLAWKVSQEYSAADRRALYERAGRYYESIDDIVHALECYTQGGNTHKVMSLLERHAALHPGVGHYYETERFYRALPEAEILKSPTLMSGMSMLCAMTLDFEASEDWYDKLCRYASSLNKDDAEYREARTRIAYLGIALPQRGSAGLIELIGNLFTILTEKKIKLPAFSVTSTLPSIMNGGKDFCEWSKKDDLLYATMRKPVESVLGRDGIGLADCAICESKFEKGDDVSSRLLGLVSLLGEIQSKGTPDIEFAAVGLLARQRVSQGRADDARTMVASLRERFSENGLERFTPNIDALLCRIDMRLGDNEAVSHWMRESAPKDPLGLRPLWRYRYLTLAMVDIANGDFENALVALASLEQYCTKCSRTMDSIHIGLLKALCHYRQGNEVWRDDLAAQLDRSLEYRFIWPVAQYGAALLPLLTDCEWNVDTAFGKNLIAATREQAVYYPRFMQDTPKLVTPLSDAEMQVLRLLCHDLSNREIGDVLGITIPTVKTHVSHILQKLGANRRSEAKAIAEKIGLA